MWRMQRGRVPLQNCAESTSLRATCLKAKRKLQGKHRRSFKIVARSTEGNEASLQAEFEQSQKQIADLRAALAAVDNAIEEAESNLDHVPSLPSSDSENLPKPPEKDDFKISIAKQISAVLGGFLVLGCAQNLGWPLRILIGTSSGLGMGYFGYSRESLDQSGAIAASLVGALTLISSFRGAVVLITFFITSSKLTTYCEDRKLDDEEAKKGGQRNWLQVACNGLMPTILILLAAALSGGKDLALINGIRNLETRRYTALTAAFLGYYSCCCGDTWASEVGQLSEDTPRLITTLRPVRKGTNGGVTKLGLVASIAGGLCMGFAFYLSSLLSVGIARSTQFWAHAKSQLLVVALGFMAGLIGSLIDSILGATIQFTGFNRKTQKLTSKSNEDVTPISGIPILSNNGVNFISASITAILAASFSMIFNPGIPV